MSQPQDPKRWKDGDADTPSQFSEALAAEAASVPDAATLARVLNGIAMDLGRPELQSAFESQSQTQAASQTQPRTSSQPHLQSQPLTSQPRLPAANGTVVTAFKFGSFKIGVGVLALAIGAGAYLALRSEPNAQSARPLAAVTPVRSGAPPNGARAAVLSAPTAPAGATPRTESPSAPATHAPSSAAAGTNPSASSISPAALPKSPAPAESHRSAASISPAPSSEPAAVAALQPHGRPISDVPPADPSAELALLERAQRALSTDARLALQLADQHRREYAHGTFAQEREMLAIDALLRLGERAAAERRARAFVRAFPASSHRTRLEDLLRSAP